MRRPLLGRSGARDRADTWEDSTGKVAAYLPAGRLGSRENLQRAFQKSLFHDSSRSGEYPKALSPHETLSPLVHMRWRVAQLIETRHCDRLRPFHVIGSAKFFRSHPRHFKPYKLNQFPRGLGRGFLTLVARLHSPRGPPPDSLSRIVFEEGAV